MQIDYLSTALSPVESQALTEQESIIERGLHTFIEVGNALLTIRDGRLYRQTHATFEAYCRERWQFSRPRAYQLMDAAQTMQNLSTIVDKTDVPPESHLRELSRLDPEDQPEVYQRASVTAPNGKVTAQHIRNVVDDYDAKADEYTGSENGYNWSDEPEPPNSMSVHYSSERHDWETPQELFDLIDREFHFSLDVCAVPETAKCTQYFTPDDDGLIQDWSDNICWMNPPYGDQIVPWMQKALDSALAGATVVCLVPARIDTQWWWDNCVPGEIRFLKGRLKFANAENSAPFPSAVVVLQPEMASTTKWWDWKNDI